MAVAPPKKQLRWGRVIFALALLAGIGAGIYLLATG
jgi:hypothetical protein